MTIGSLSLLLQDVVYERGWSLQDRVSTVVRLLTAAAICVGILFVARRVPWPRPFRIRFALMHVALAPIVALTWVGLSRLLEAPFLGFGPTVPHETEFLGIAIIAYPIIAGIMYSVESTARAARAESAAARTQLAALRAQLHPHFLFNALHTVVQLIPVKPALAMEAAEIVAELLRSSLEEQRDEVPLTDEWRFVSRYLAMERLRFGDRLVVREELSPDLMTGQAVLPAFALLTLVENAVRHGAAPRVAATEVRIAASMNRDGDALTLRVTNTAYVPPADRPPTPTLTPAVGGVGTGLARLREHLLVLHGRAATLTAGPVDGGAAYEAVLMVPQHTPRRVAAATRA